MASDGLITVLIHQWEVCTPLEYSPVYGTSQVDHGRPVACLVSGPMLPLGIRPGNSQVPSNASTLTLGLTPAPVPHQLKTKLHCLLGFNNEYLSK